MSDTFDWGSLDTSFLSDPQTEFANTNTSLFANMPDFAGIFMPSAGASVGSFPSIFPPQNLPGPSGQGFTGVLGDLTSLVGKFYNGVTQATLAKSASDLAAAKAKNQLETVKTTPNVWLVAAIVGAGFFALEVMDRKK